MFDSLKRLKMGIQSTLEELDFDNADMAGLNDSSQDSAKPRWAALTHSFIWQYNSFVLAFRLVVHPKEEARVRARVEVVKVKEGK